MKLFNKEGLTKLKVQGEDGSIHIEKNHTVSSVNEPAASPEQSGTEKSSNLLEITAEQVGTFYTNKEEGSDETFVSVGDTVSKGDTVGLIEAMKVFNEITTEHEGTIEEILVEHGDVVEYGQVIMTVKPEEV